MSDRALWLEESCPTCRVAPGPALPSGVFAKDWDADGATHRTRVVGTAVPDMQGSSGRALSHALRTRGVAYA